MVAILSIQIRLPGCRSLKEKRSRLKPLLVRLHREFNISTAEMDLQDTWDQAVIACSMVNSDVAVLQRSLGQVLKWLISNWPDVQVIDDHMELVS